MRPKLVKCERVILAEISETGLNQKDIALTYAYCLDSDEEINWARINAAIIHRWSASGLSRIKTMAWKIWQDRP